MKKFLFLFVAFLYVLTGKAALVDVLTNQMYTPAELQGATSTLRIALRNMHANDYTTYYNGNTKASFSSAHTELLEPVTDGVAGTHYLRLANPTAVQDVPTIETISSAIATEEEFVDGGMYIIHGAGATNAYFYEMDHNCDAKGAANTNKRIGYTSTKPAVGSTDFTYIFTLEKVVVDGVVQYAFRTNSGGYIDGVDHGATTNGDPIHTTGTKCTFTMTRDGSHWRVNSTVPNQDRKQWNTGGADTGGLVLYCACSMHRQPACMLFSNPIDSLAAAGAVLADVWLEDVSMPVVDSLGQDSLDYVKDGMTVTIGPDGLVTVE